MLLVGTCKVAYGADSKRIELKHLIVRITRNLNAKYAKNRSELFIATWGYVKSACSTIALSLDHGY